MDIFEALATAGYTKVGECTRAGRVMEYTFFNENGVKVEINYRYAEQQPLSRAGIEMEREGSKV